MDPIVLYTGGALALFALSKANAMPADGIPIASIPATTATGAPAPPPVSGNYADSRYLETLFNAEGYYIGTNLPPDVLNAAVNYFCFAQLYIPLFNAAFAGRNSLALGQFDTSQASAWINNIAAMEGLAPTSSPSAPPSGGTATIIPLPSGAFPTRPSGGRPGLGSMHRKPGIGIEPVTITAVVSAVVGVVRFFVDLFRADTDGMETLLAANAPAVDGMLTTLGANQDVADKVGTILLTARVDLACLELVGAYQRGVLSDPRFQPIYHPNGSPTATATPWTVLGLEPPSGQPVIDDGSGFFQVVDTAVAIGEAAVGLYENFNQQAANDAA